MSEITVAEKSEIVQLIAACEALMQELPPVCGWGRGAQLAAEGLLWSALIEACEAPDGSTLKLAGYRAAYQLASRTLERRQAAPRGAADASEDAGDDTTDATPGLSAARIR